MKRPNRPAPHRPKRCPAIKIFDGIQVIGTVEWSGERFDSFSSGERFIGAFDTRGGAVEAIRAHHKAARTVRGVASR